MWPSIVSILLVSELVLSMPQLQDDYSQLELQPRRLVQYRSLSGSLAANYLQDLISQARAELVILERSNSEEDDPGPLPTNLPVARPMFVRQISQCLPICSRDSISTPFVPDHAWKDMMHKMANHVITHQPTNSDTNSNDGSAKKQKSVRFSLMARLALDDEMQQIFQAFKPHIEEVFDGKLQVGKLISYEELAKEEKPKVSQPLEDSSSTGKPSIPKKPVKVVFTFSASQQCQEKRYFRCVTFTVNYICRVFLTRYPPNSELVNPMFQEEMHKLQKSSIQCDVDTPKASTGRTGGILKKTELERRREAFAKRRGMTF